MVNNIKEQYSRRKCILSHLKHNTEWGNSDFVVDNKLMKEDLILIRNVIDAKECSSCNSGAITPRQVNCMEGFYRYLFKENRQAAFHELVDFVRDYGDTDKEFLNKTEKIILKTMAKRLYGLLNSKI